MQMKLSVALVLGVAIVLAAAMVCATMLALNLRTTYSLSDPKIGPVYARLLQSGCESTGYSVAGTPIAVSCPLWVRP